MYVQACTWSNIARPLPSATASQKQEWSLLGDEYPSRFAQLATRFRWVQMTITLGVRHMVSCDDQTDSFVSTMWTHWTRDCAQQGMLACTGSVHMVSLRTAGETNNGSGKKESYTATWLMKHFVRAGYF